MDERAAREHLARLARRLLRHLLGGDDVGEEQIGVDEDAEREAAERAEHQRGDKQGGRERACARAAGRGGPQQREPLLPNPRRRRGAGAGGVLAARDQQHAAVLHALDLALQHAELGRVALVVGRVDREQHRLDALQARRGVVVARGIPLVEMVVGVAAERRAQALRRAAGRPSRASAPPCRAPGCRRWWRCRRTPRRTAGCAAASCSCRSSTPGRCGSSR